MDLAPQEQKHVRVFANNKRDSSSYTSTREIVTFFIEDNGFGEFVQLREDWCRDLVIEVQSSPRYKNSLNGVAERAIGYLTQFSKSMMFHAQEKLENSSVLCDSARYENLGQVTNFGATLWSSGNTPWFK